MHALKDELLSEISDVPASEMPDLIQLIRLFKGNRRRKNQGFSNIKKWRGGLKNLNSTSVELQHKISNIWSKKYVSD